MTPEERRTAEFFEHLMRANLKVPAERAKLRHELWKRLSQIGHIDISPPMTDDLMPEHRGENISSILELDTDEDLDEDRVLRPLFNRILYRLRGVSKGILTFLHPDGGLNGIPLKTTVVVRFHRQDDGSIVAAVHSQDYLSDLFWQGLMPLFQLKPCPFVICDQCFKPFLRKEKGVKPKYCSKACKEKSIPFASRRTEYMQERRQREREKRLRLARDAIRQGRSEQERMESLSKAFPQKSRRALAQLLNKARQKQRRTQPVKEKEV